MARGSRLSQPTRWLQNTCYGIQMNSEWRGWVVALTKFPSAAEPGFCTIQQKTVSFLLELELKFTAVSLWMNCALPEHIHYFIYQLSRPIEKKTATTSHDNVKLWKPPGIHKPLGSTRLKVKGLLMVSLQTDWICDLQYGNRTVSERFDRRSNILTCSRCISLLKD